MEPDEESKGYKPRKTARKCKLLPSASPQSHSIVTLLQRNKEIVTICYMALANEAVSIVKT